MKAFRYIMITVLAVMFMLPGMVTAKNLGEDCWVGDLLVKRSLTVKGTAQVSIQGQGKNYYVDSATGTAYDDGTTWEKALSTVDAAINKCTANKGYVIHVAAGHAETIAAADGFDTDVAGIKIVGYGTGADMPEFTFSATASTVAVGAANVTFENLRFIAGVSAIVMGISVEAGGDNFTMVDCVFPKPTTNSWEFLDAIDVADGGNNIKIIGCEYYNDEAGAAPNHFIDAGNGTAGPEKLQVIGCIISGDFAVSGIWSDEPCDEALIAYNVIINHTTGQHCVEFTDTGTGAIVGNSFYGDTEGAILDPGSMYVFGNEISTAIDNEAIPRWVINNGLNHLCALDGATQVYPENAVDDSILAKLLSKSDPADISDYDCQTDSLEAISDAVTAVSTTLTAVPKCVVKADGAYLTGLDPIFTISGGPVRAKIVGLVTTVVGGATNGRLQHITTTPAATVELSAGAVACDADAAGTFYYNIGATSVFTPSAGLGFLLNDPVLTEEVEFLLAPGVVQFSSSAAQSGVVAWYMTYEPLSPLSVVTAAP